MVSYGAILCAAMALSGDYPEPCEPDLELGLAYIRQMRNSDLDWNISCIPSFVYPRSTPMLRELCSALDSRHLDALADAMWDEERFEIADVILRHKLPFETSNDLNESDCMDLSFRIDQFGQGIPDAGERLPFQEIWRDRIRQKKSKNPSAGARRSVSADNPSVRPFPRFAWAVDGAQGNNAANRFFPQAGEWQLGAKSCAARNHEAEMFVKKRLQKLRIEGVSGRRWVVEVETVSVEPQR